MVETQECSKRVVSLSSSSLNPRFSLYSPTSHLPIISTSNSKRPRGSSPSSHSSSPLSKRPTPTPDLNDLHISPQLSRQMSAQAQQLYTHLKAAWARGDEGEVKQLLLKLKVRWYFSRWDV